VGCAGAVGVTKRPSEEVEMDGISHRVILMHLEAVFAVEFFPDIVPALGTLIR
jgi:hypothetical protein